MTRSSARLNDCSSMWQVTGSYFGTGKLDAARRQGRHQRSSRRPSTARRPETATEEEICADPDLADNDQRLNRAWKALLPRLDEATRRALTEDQRNWVSSQTEPISRNSCIRPGRSGPRPCTYTTDGRDKLDRLQRERIALLDGFDDKRSGLAGIWLAYNAIIQVTVDKDGGAQRQGLEVGPGRLEGRLRLRHVGQDRRRRVPLRRETHESGHAGARPCDADRQPAATTCLRQKATGRTAPSSDDEPKCKRNYSITPRPRGCFPPAPPPTSTISAKARSVNAATPSNPPRARRDQ